MLKRKPQLGEWEFLVLLPELLAPALQSLLAPVSGLIYFFQVQMVSRTRTWMAA